MKILLTIVATIIGLSSSVMANGSFKSHHSSPYVLVKVILGYDNYKRPIYGTKSVLRSKYYGSSNYYRSNSRYKSSRRYSYSRPSYYKNSKKHYKRY